MKFRSMFKVRQPGNGGTFENRVKKAAGRARAMKPKNLGDNTLVGVEKQKARGVNAK